MIFRHVQRALGESDRHIGFVMRKHVTVSATFTRPADVTVYTTLDAMSNSTTVPVPLEFANAARQVGAGGKIVSAQLVSDNPGTPPTSFNLQLFDTTVAATNDNAALDVTDAEALTAVGGVIWLAADRIVTASNALYSKGGLSLGFNGVGTSLFGVVQVVGAYTPVSGEVFTIRLVIEQH